MAKIKKIQENGTTVYPVTISKAVKNIRTGKTLDEIILGDKSATEEEFSFRPTAGVNRNTLNDGAARIHSIKGRSVVANQLLKDVNSVSSGVRHTIVSGVDTWSGTSTSIATGILLDLTVGHKVLFSQNVIKNPNSISITFKGAGTGKEVFMTVTSQSTEVYWTLPQGVSVDGVVIYLKVIDLTQMFGAGNEPTTVEEFYQRLPIGVDLNAYNAGEIVDGNYGAIKTVGFNAFNGTYAKVLGGVQYYLGGNYTSLGFATEEGGTTEAITVPTSSEVVGGSAPADRLYTPSQNGYIYATGENICISLYWPTEYGNLYGTYQPYKPFVRDLGDIIAKYFTDGVMRSAGSVRDEIRFNYTTQKWEAVQRVGVRAYTEGDENDTAVTTDGTNTNYALATPDVKEMDEIPSFDFDVSDYGTEELIVAEGVQSAPLSAEIFYDYDSISTKLHYLRKELNEDTIKNWGSSTQFVKGDGSLDNREFAEKKDIADLENKANKQGTYQKMTVGFAQEIVGDGSATTEEFSFRPTAGEDRNVANTTYYEGERNGVARIEKLKGNSVVFNQQAKQSYFIANVSGSTLTKLSNGSIKVDVVAGITNGGLTSNNLNIILGHKYFVGLDLTSAIGLKYLCLGQRFVDVASNRYDIVEATTKNIVVYQTSDVDFSFTAKLTIVDLTQMFGAGNESATVEEFYQRLPKGVDINAYNAGKIVDGNYGAIKTVGFNAFNGTYAKVCGGCPYYLGGNYTFLGFTTEEGGTTEAITLPTSTESIGTTPSDRLYTPTQNGYIYAEGENININLSWDTEYGYLNGTYQPYKPFERDLSWAAKYFPNGMRSAGSVRDEIRFNPTTQKWEAVQKVGVVDLGSLMWIGVSDNKFYAPVSDMAAPNNPAERVEGLLCKYLVTTNTVPQEIDDKSMMRFKSNDASTRFYVRDSAYTDVDSFTTAMQGVMLNYELAEPDVKEITEDVNLDFDVSDYGTEELIVAEGAQSAPLVADIVYEPNALNAIKQVPDILKRLKALESAVAQQTTNVEPSEI